MLNKAVATTGLKREDICHLMKLAIEEATCDYFAVKDCEANLRYETVYPVFHFPESMSMEEAEMFKPNAVYNDLIYPEFTFGMLHEDIIVHCRELFTRNLRIMQEQNLHKKWAKMKHRVVGGYIDTVYANRVTISIDDEQGLCGVMLKPEWVPSEIPMYNHGKFLNFYVVKVAQDKSLVVVYLSRGTPSFPIALIREKVHGPKVKIIKRLRGKKSWIKSSEPIPQPVLEEVRRELKGEMLEIVLETFKTRGRKKYSPGPNVKQY